MVNGMHPWDCGDDAQPVLHRLLSSGKKGFPGAPAVGTEGKPAPPVKGYLAGETYEVMGPGVSTEWANLVNSSPTKAYQSDDFEDYRKVSADITMRGGTTSGIVYPLAVCEIARSFRLRNIGGASAGAIAAAAAAAAELGRIRQMRGTVAAACRCAGAGTEEPPKGGAHSAGFVGLAQIAQWLSQNSEQKAVKDEFRLASLFKPLEGRLKGESNYFEVLRLFQLKRHWLRMVIPVARALRWRWLFLALAVFVAVVAVFTVVPLYPQSGWLASWPLRALVQVGAFAGVVLVLSGGVRIVGRVRAWTASRRHVRNLEKWSQGNVPYTNARRLDRLRVPGNWGALTLDVGGIVVGLALGSTAVVASEPQSSPEALRISVLLLLFSLAAGLALTSVTVYSLMRFNSNFRSKHHCGLLSGDTLVQWIDTQLRILAGQRCPVAFGDLWLADAARPDAAGWEKMSSSPRERVVNLQLMVTDLCQQRPLVFPLPADAEMEESMGSALYADVNDLKPIFGEALSELIAPANRGTKCQPAEGGTNYLRWNQESGEFESVALRPLAQPWDMPVVFAVRASMALPGLFKAVRVYRLRTPNRVSDDLGNLLQAQASVKTEFRSPTLPGPRPGSSVVEGMLAEELWLSDGGITSNFPVHFFDRPLPKWPTFGLNLGPYPVGFEHQRVWLPEDWQTTVPPREALGPSAGDFVGAIVSTARAWRDVMQTAMPSTRGRVAWVRQNPKEGGTNLFMSNETIAAMCVRGALAGARLRTRFEHDSSRWQRHQWLRLRVALRMLDELREKITEAARPYEQLLTQTTAEKAAALNSQNGTVVPEDRQYLPEDPQFWKDAAAFLTAFTGLPCDGADVRNNVPEPAPELRPTPQV